MRTIGERGRLEIVVLFVWSGLVLKIGEGFIERNIDIINWFKKFARLLLSLKRVFQSLVCRFLEDSPSLWEFPQETYSKIIISTQKWILGLPYWNRRQVLKNQRTIRGNSRKKSNHSRGDWVEKCSRTEGSYDWRGHFGIQWFCLEIRKVWFECSISKQ